MTFQIKTNKKETENKTIRFPVDLINQIEKQIYKKGITFSSFVIQACEYAIKDLEKEQSKNLD